MVVGGPEMNRLSTAMLLIATCLILTSCASEPQSQLPEFTTPAQLSKLIASMDAGDSASLELVSISESQGGSVDAGTHEYELFSSGYERADIGAREWVNGIPTTLVVPMWYGPDTTIQIKGREPEPMLEAVETTPSLGGPFYWFGDPVVSIEFHMEDEVLVLDSVVVPTTR